MVRKPLPDSLDHRILAELQKDARASNRSIARALGVSAPTVAQRIKRMEQVGMIRGYRVDTALGAPNPEEPMLGLACAKCKGPIHGPARTRQFHGNTYAFCCAMCEELFADRFKAKRPGPRALGATVVMLGWVVAFGLSGASCLTMGPCLLPPPPGVPPDQVCPPAVRWRDESDEPLEPTNALGAGDAWRPLGWRNLPRHAGHQMA